jgi:hypothetical protein
MYPRPRLVLRQQQFQSPAAPSIQLAGQLTQA